MKSGIRGYEYGFALVPLIPMSLTVGHGWKGCFLNLSANLVAHSLGCLCPRMTRFFIPTSFSWTYGLFSPHHLNYLAMQSLNHVRLDQLGVDPCSMMLFDE